METINMLLYGFSVCLEPYNLLACTFGVLLGTLVGVLPGIGTIGAISLLLPFSYHLDTTAAMIMFSGIYYGSKYGGSTTSILLNLPGETASVVTCIDGYAMAQKGRAGAALAISAIGSFIAGTLGVIGLTIFAPPLSNVAVVLGPPEYLAIALVSLLILTKLTGKSIVKSIFMAVLGIIFGTFGLDIIFGISRFTFGIENLDTGFDLSIIAMGIFGLGELFTVMSSPQMKNKVPTIKLKDLYPTREEYNRAKIPILRSGILGFLIGLLPGPSGTISSFASYSVEKHYSKYPDEFGHGAIEGVAGPESANNSANSATMIPLMSLGLPFCGGTAILLSGFMIHGVSPGPLFINDRPDLFWGIIASMYVGNLMLLAINLPLVGIFVQLLKTPLHYLLPLVILITLTGAFAINNNPYDVLWVSLFGVLGFLLNYTGFEAAPLIIGLVIGPELEQRLVQSLIICNGSVSAIVSRPITAAILCVGLIFVIFMLIQWLRKYRRIKEGVV